MSALLTQIGLPVLLSVISEALSGSPHPAARAASVALRDLYETLARGEVSESELKELHRHTETLGKIHSEAYRTHITEINTSLRSEIASSDPYVRRMRPTFGYLMAVTWAVQMLALAWVIIDDPAQAAAVLEGFAALGMIWSVGLSVLGIYVYKRSEDKRLAENLGINTLRRGSSDSFETKNRVMTRFMMRLLILCATQLTISRNLNLNRFDITNSPVMMNILTPDH